MMSKICPFRPLKWGITAVLVTLLSCETAQKADLVIHNGTIYTMNPEATLAAMVAVIDGKIVDVGSKAKLGQWVGRETEVLDLLGKTMTPGLIESHGHLMSLGRSKLQLQLNHTKSYAELLARVAESVKRSEPGEWILGRGWHQSKWNPAPEPLVRGFQTHQALSEVSPENPVFLRHASGHAAMINAKAMEIAGITRFTEFNEGGEIIKDSRGNPTGILTERAMNLIKRHIPESTAANELRALELAIGECLANGITSFQDAGSDSHAIALYRELLKQGKLKVRLWVMLSGSDEALLNEWFARGPEIGSGNGFLTIRAIKLVADGALGSRGAWLLKPYTDRPDHFGHATTPMEDIYRISREALRNGFQVCTHAIGDRANREVLDQYERVFREYPDRAKGHRFRIEHAQHLNPGDIPRFAELGIIASMQGIHLASDRPWAIERLGKERIVEGAYVWQKLLRSGAKVINGSDTPVEPLNPIECFYASVSRRTLNGTPAEGYEPDQKMTREQALRSYTLDAAYGAREEKIKGSIEIGKYPDFTVFSHDIMKVAEDDLLNTRVVYTIVNGKIVYREQ